MRHRSLAALCLTLVGATAPLAPAQPAPPAPTAPTETPAQRDARMAWWREARLGLFIHWGLYAIPAGTWKEQRHQGTSEWLMHGLKIPPEEYEPLAKGFYPLNFDAQRWVEIAKDAGMKYIVITSKHHDGFCLFNSKLTDYDIMDASPFKRDVLGELARACSDARIKLCFYHSILDWHHPLAKKETWPKYAEHMRGQVTELLKNYGPVGVMWFDGEWEEPWTEEQGKDLYALCRSLQPATIINNRVGKGRDGMAGLSKDPTAAGDFGTPEQEVPGGGLPGVDWESCITMNDSWGFKIGDDHWKSDEEILRLVCETASKGGNLLLNVGPTATGEIPIESIARLKKLSEWMQVNGEAIYGTQAGPFKRLPWGYATSKRIEGGTRLYLIVFDWPEKGVLEVPGLDGAVTSAALLHDESGKLKTDADGRSVWITVPTKADMELKEEIASVVVLDLKGEPKVSALPIQPDENGVITLRAIDADISGGAKYERGKDRDCVGFWTDPNAVIEWSFEVPRHAQYQIVLSQAAKPGESGGALRLQFDHSPWSFTPEAEEGGGCGTWTWTTTPTRGLMESIPATARVQATTGWGDFVDNEFGPLELAPGRCTLRASADEIINGALMNLRSVTLRPVK